MFLGEIGCDGIDWIDLAQWRAVVNTVMNLRVHNWQRLRKGSAP
jgi:hypothetical protein